MEASSKRLATLVNNLHQAEKGPQALLGGKGCERTDDDLVGEAAGEH